MDESCLSTDNGGENYGLDKIRRIMKTCKKEKPGLSYIALIALAIQKAQHKRLLLSDIYHWISKTFPFYKSKTQSWRNSVRHNLSLNECFVKCGRAEGNKGNFWAIHPANQEDFSRGDFRRRRARCRVKRCHEAMQEPGSEVTGVTCLQLNGVTSSGRNGHYVEMSTTRLPTSELIRTYGAEAILSKDEQRGLALGETACGRFCREAIDNVDNKHNYTIGHSQSQGLYEYATHNNSWLSNDMADRSHVSGSKLPSIAVGDTVEFGSGCPLDVCQFSTSPLLHERQWW